MDLCTCSYSIGKFKWLVQTGLSHDFVFVKFVNRLGASLGILFVDRSSEDMASDAQSIQAHVLGR